jgi:hypothetical protein
MGDFEILLFLSPCSQHTIQAVKTLEKASLRSVFVAEARAMMPLAHDNVLRLLGITVADSEPWRAVLEYCEHDSLHTVVSSHECGVFSGG